MEALNYFVHHAVMIWVLAYLIFADFDVLFGRPLTPNLVTLIIISVYAAVFARLTRTAGGRTLVLHNVGLIRFRCISISAKFYRRKFCRPLANCSLHCTCRSNHPQCHCRVESSCHCCWDIHCYLKLCKKWIFFHANVTLSLQTDIHTHKPHISIKRS